MSSGDKWCKHRTPFTDDHKTCKVGVDFHQFMGKGNIRLMPCLGECAEAIAICPQFQAYTEKELAEKHRLQNERFDRIGKIRGAIVASIKTTGKSSGSIPCPCCNGGSVSFAQASNGHVHAGCSTPGCAAWME